MLTGTPLQNDLEELQNLLQFLLPDVFCAQEINQSADLQVGQSLALLLVKVTSCRCSRFKYCYHAMQADAYIAVAHMLSQSQLSIGVMFSTVKAA